MHFLLSVFASASVAQPGTQPSPLGMFLPLIMIFVIMWLLIFRPQARKQNLNRARKKGISSGALSFRQARKQFSPTLGVIYGGIPMDSQNSQTTRYLAGSALKSGSSFRRRVLQFLSNRVNALGPELGYDLKIIGKLCRYFESRETIYQSVFLVLSIIFLFSVCGYLFAFEYYSQGKIIRISILFLLVAWIVRFYKAVIEEKIIINNFQKATFNPDTITEEFSADLEPDQISAIDQDENNLVIYNRFDPFIGAGINVGGWSFAIDINKPKEELGQSLTIHEFTLEELYSYIDVSINNLQFKGLKIKDTFYIIELILKSQ